MRIRLFTIGLLAAIPLIGQSNLILSSGNGALGLTLASGAGSAPAALQWSFTYAASDVLSINAVVAGGAAAAGKALTCAAAAGLYRCVLAGANATPIPDGLVAVVTATPNRGVATIAIGLTNAIGATPAGENIPMRGGGGTAATGTTTSSAPPPVVAPALTGFGCLPGSLVAGGAAACTVTLSGPGGGTVTLTSNNAALSLPSLVAVAAAATTAGFTATAGTFFTGQSATVTATLNGVSRTAPIALTPGPPTVRSLACAPSTLAAGAASSCTVTLTTPGGGTVVLSSNNAAVSLPPSVTAPAGATTAGFIATAGSPATAQTATLTAKLNGSTQTASLVVQAATQTALGIASLSCVPDLSAAGSLNCAIQLSRGAPAGGVQITIESNSARLQPPAPMRIAAGQQGVNFRIHVIPSDQDVQPRITASIPGASRAISVSITGARPTAVTLAGSTVPAGGRLSGEIRLTPSNVPDVVTVSLSATLSSLHVPVSIAFRPGQTRATFQISADSRARAQSGDIVAQYGQTAVRTRVFVISSRSPSLSGPHEVTARFGEEAAFTVSAFDPQGLPLVYSVDTLPKGATFDGTSGSFSWTPQPAQAGIYELSVTATNSDSVSANAGVTIAVGSGRPVITGVHNEAGRARPACSPGALATLAGRWLAPGSDPVADPTGPAELGGIRVTVNGGAASVVYASPQRVDFVCPALEPGSIVVSVENQAGAAEPAATVMAAVAPALLTLDGSGAGQGLVYFAGSTEMVASRDYLALGEPAQAGDAIALRATGIGSVSDAPPGVMVGGMPAQVTSVTEVPGVAGVVEIIALVPAGVAEGPDVPVYILVRRPEAPAGVRGERENLRLRSNWVTIAVESAQ